MVAAPRVVRDDVISVGPTRCRDGHIGDTDELGRIARVCCTMSRERETCSEFKYVEGDSMQDREFNHDV